MNDKDLTKEDIVEKLGSLSVMELIALTKQLEEKWGVKAEPQIAPMMPFFAPGDVPALEQTEFDVILTSFPADKKMSVIKAVREITQIGIKEAKDLAEAVPKMIKEAISKSDADELKRKLEEAGAVVEIK